MEDAAARKNATSLQVQQQMAYEGYHEAHKEFRKIRFECFEIVMITLTVQILLYVRKIQVSDLLRFNISRWELVLAVCTGLRFLLVASFFLWTAVSWNAFLFPWLALMFLSFACIVWLIRQAASGKDNTLHRRSTISLDDM